MSTKNYTMSAIVLLLVLTTSASALVVSDTQTITSSLFKMYLVGADATTSKGTLQVDPTGNITFTGRVVFNRVDNDPNIPSRLVMNGGICNMTDRVDFPETIGPAEIWINKGIFTVHEFRNNAPVLIGGGTIYIGGGSMIVQTGYLAGDTQKDPALWEANGSMQAQPGYVILYENLGGGAVKIYGLPIISSPNPSNGYEVTNLMLPNLCWKTNGVKICKLWYGQASATVANYKTLLTARGNSRILDPNTTEDVCFATPGLPLSGNAFTGVTYSWAVEGYANVVGGEPNTLVDVAVYQFKVLTRPVVRTQPQPQYVNAGETAVFTAVAESYTALTAWNWYKSGSGTPITGTKTGPDGNNQYQLTLTIPSVGWDSQGVYSCRPTNAAGLVNSTGANLVVKTLVAQWKFENNLLDTAPKTVHTIVYNGTAAAAESYVASGGIDTKALLFDGTSQYITLPAGFSDFTTGATISVWAVMDAVGNRKNVRFFDFAQQLGQFDFANSVNFCRYGTTTGLQFRGGNNTNVLGAIIYDQWQHYLVTMDVAGQVKFYVDGYQIGTGIVSLPQTVTRAVNYIGEAVESGLTHNGQYFKGKIGDLRIYNYALSAEDVKALYYTELYGPFCENRPAPDLDGSCIVDFADIVMFVSDWLGCGLWPDTACF